MLFISQPEDSQYGDILSTTPCVKHTQIESKLKSYLWLPLLTDSRRHSPTHSAAVAAQEATSDQRPRLQSLSTARKL